MKTVGIGDMVLATAIVEDLQRAYPDAVLVLLTGPDNAEVARLVPAAEVVPLPTARPWVALPLIRAQRLDALLDLGQWTRLEALYAALSGARWTAGFATHGFERHFAYDVSVEHSAQLPELENFQRLASTLGVSSKSPPRLTSASPVADPPTADPYVVFHLWPGGFRSECREWPAKSWRELAARVIADGYRVVLTGGPGDRDRTEIFARSCGELAAEMICAAGRYPIAELVGVLAAARCVVSVNTGLMHLAAATGTSTIALNGPTSAQRWGPVGERVVSVNSNLPGCGFLNLGFEYDGQRTDCMHGISVERVAAETLAWAHV
jgi:ADP-heptose:LPS heptosyltransferase